MNDYHKAIYEAEEFMGGPATLPKASSAQDAPPQDAPGPPQSTGGQHYPQQMISENDATGTTP